MARPSERRWFALARAAALAGIVGLACAAGVGAPARAGELGRDDIVRRFPPPLQVGEKLREVPAWPLASELEPDAGPVGYVFESIDLAPIPGFEGTPFNLLVAIDRQGRFLDVEVLRQHEPVFLSGLGPQPLHEFVRQYAGHGVGQSITVGSGYGLGRGTTQGDEAGAGGRVVLDGVAKATASVRIVNQTVLAAALSVARARLGFVAPVNASRPPARPREDSGLRLSIDAMLSGGHVARLRLTNADVDRLFADSDAADLDDAARSDPGGLFADVYLAYLNAPQIGRSLLGNDEYARLRALLYHNQHVFWIGAAGRHALVDEHFVPGAAAERLRLSQDGLPLELRDFGGEDWHPAGIPGLRFGRIFQVEAHAGLDPGRAVDLDIVIARARGMILPQVTERSARLAYAPPPELFDYPPAPLPEWLVAWRARLPEIAVLAVALAALFALLWRPRPLLPRRRLMAFRTAWLFFILVFLGWFAQGQLSIVQLTGAIKSLAAGHDLSSFLYDPVSLLVIAILPASFLLWGRGPFCGWLCPFGALQELIGKLARRLQLRQWRLPVRLARGLDRGRFALLGGLAVAAGVMPSAAERMVEVEPFKTAITVGFDREWPYVLYAVGLLAAGAVVYKFFCRYLCPLGAFMELGGLLRRRAWLGRRPECGRPCQVCRHACLYDAIERDGRIDYRRCHQCLDCVSIHGDVQRCVPLIRLQRAGVAAGAVPVITRSTAAGAGGRPAGEAPARPPAASEDQRV